MKKLFLIALLMAMISQPSHSLELKVKLDGIEPGKPIPEKFAYCAPNSVSGGNLSPAIAWEKGPEGTKSYAVIVVDRDVPTNLAEMNKKDKQIEASSPRQNFYHWILVNVPPAITSIPEGKGKDTNYGQQLLNDYLKFTGQAKTPQNVVKFSGYDGPCPPWNDQRLHNYHFKVYALSEQVTPGENYSGDELMRSISPHILAEGEVVGTYTLNPTLLAKPAAAPVENKTK